MTLEEIMEFCVCCSDFRFCCSIVACERPELWTYMGMPDPQASWSPVQKWHLLETLQSVLWFVFGNSGVLDFELCRWQFYITQCQKVIDLKYLCVSLSLPLPLSLSVPLFSFPSSPISPHGPPFFLPGSPYVSSPPRSSTSDLLYFA